MLQRIDELETTYSDGRPVPIAPDCRRITVQKSSRGHGPYIIYQVHEDSLEVLRVLHTSRDWQTRFIKGQR